MKWAEVEVRCSPATVDAVSALLTAMGCGGTAIRDETTGRRGAKGRERDPSAVKRENRDGSDRSDGSRLTAGGSRITPSVALSSVLGYLPVDDRLEGRLAELRTRLKALPLFGLEVEDGLTLRTVQDQDWESAWKEFFKPLRIGRRLVVRPSWEEYSPRPDDQVIELDPGMAFGTGAHPTTQLCLEALEDVVKPGVRVLDFGTGSGILAIAAARLGAVEVMGLDTDPVAADAADRNVTINHLCDRVRIQGGDLDALDPGDTFDGIVANILAGVILDYADRLAARCRPGGWLVASGIIDHRAAAVAAGLRAAGFSEIEARHRGEWAALLARRASGVQTFGRSGVHEDETPGPRS